MTEPSNYTLLLEHLEATRKVARHLKRYLDFVYPVYPLTAKSIEAIDDAMVEHLDAMLKRYEQMLTMLGEHLFKLVAVLEMDPSAGQTKRDLANFMEKVGVVKSAQEFSDCADVRNRLTHLYPFNPEKQVKAVNEAILLTHVLLSTFKNLEKYVDNRKHTWKPS